ncbi:hypothetical protein HW555_009768 [Spodoptera exigua]|uniref:Uncharacterized protein n=1 Tax=Spodoptera exigua TaxID=7107 RepID=A0A835G8J9_SPOEX|nr:hypothetical protein HW555_009768 [Spodoptera exigua]
MARAWSWKPRGASEALRATQIGPLFDYWGSCSSFKSKWCLTKAVPSGRQQYFFEGLITDYRFKMNVVRETEVAIDGPEIKKFIHVLVTFVIFDFVLERIILGTNVANLIIGICRFYAAPLFDALLGHWKMFKGDIQTEAPPPTTTD